jgi:hypothetical protein
METLDRPPLPPHGVHLNTYRNELETELKAALCDPGDGWFDSFALEMRVWRENNGSGVRIEWLLTYGGPTIRLEWDDRWTNGTLWHSWGHDASGREQLSTEFDGELLESLATVYGAIE